MKSVLLIDNISAKLYRTGRTAMRYKYKIVSDGYKHSFTAKSDRNAIVTFWRYNYASLGCKVYNESVGIYD